jgi:predicted DCC family thiol-disulfide oxidoreductase YuxK
MPDRPKITAESRRHPERKFTILYDSLCPVCRREMQFLSLVGRADSLLLVDIADPSFRPEDYGLTINDCVGSLRGFSADGGALDGMDTIRAMYEAAGLGWLMSWTKLPIISAICDRGYKLFARYRPRFSSFKPDLCETDRCAPKK